MVVFAFAAFCLAASAVYFANDALDVEADREHPTKRHRPIAAGIISIGLAWRCVALLAALALGVAAADLTGEKAASTRKSLAGYSASHLRFVWQAMAGLTIVTYSLWAFQLGAGDRSVHWHELSIVPWSFVFLRYAMFVDAGRAGEPEEVVIGDRVIVAIGAVWLILFSLGVFTGGHVL